MGCKSSEESPLRNKIGEMNGSKEWDIKISMSIVYVYGKKICTGSNQFKSL